MDISYLLFLQNFRLAINDALTPFLEGISSFTVTYGYFLPVFVYWCVNKRKGLYVYTSLTLSMFLNPIIKLTVCAYRPWVRDARIIPAGNAIASAGGYSFPSGHTMTATPIYGGLAVISRKKIIAAFWIALVLITGFSRNYLGVHTPQDVLIGFVMGGLSLYVTAKIFAYIDAHREKENLFLIAMVIAGIAGLLYVFTKSYPMEYDANGKLLVNPMKMRYSGCDGISALFGFALGRYLERRFIKFKATGFNLKGIILCVVGLVIFGLIMTSRSIFTKNLGSEMGRIIYGVVLNFYIVAVWPMVIKFFEGKK